MARLAHNETSAIGVQKTMNVCVMYIVPEVRTSLQICTIGMPFSMLQLNGQATKDLRAKVDVPCHGLVHRHLLGALAQRRINGEAKLPLVALRPAGGDRPFEIQFSVCPSPPSGTSSANVSVLANPVHSTGT